MKITGPTLLQIVFITLKLLDKIDWSWFWVLAPTLIPVGLLVFYYFIYGVFLLFESKRSRVRRKAQEMVDQYEKLLRR